MKELTYLAKSHHHYDSLHMKAGLPEKWEDGMHTDGGKGNYEWWYFDAHLEDGSKIVIVFYTKAITDINKPLTAYAALNIDYKDGTKLERYLPSVSFNASKEQCDVHIGKNYFKGDLNTYHIHLEDHDFVLDVEFINKAESWRPETGHLYFGKHHYFAWLVAVPEGTAIVTYRFPDRTISTKGACYHDHNWGNKSLHKLIHHWYWSRSTFGSYTVIASQIIPRKQYGNKPLYIIAIFKAGKKIVDDAQYLQLYKNDTVPALGGKPMSNELSFCYDDGVYRFDLHLVRKRNIIETYLIQQEFKRKLAKWLTGFNGAYFRITGDATFKAFTNRQLTETYTNDNSIWELMFFGNPDKRSG